MSERKQSRSVGFEGHARERKKIYCLKIKLTIGVGKGLKSYIK